MPHRAGCEQHKLECCIAQYVHDNASLHIAPSYRAEVLHSHNALTDLAGCIEQVCYIGSHCCSGPASYTRLHVVYAGRPGPLNAQGMVHSAEAASYIEFYGMVDGPDTSTMAVC